MESLQSYKLLLEEENNYVNFSCMNTTALHLTAQRLRMDVISSNMANAETTRATI